jgi:hypothetical protein
MKILAAAAMLALLTAPVLAQSSSTSGSQASQVNQNAQAASQSDQQKLAAAQKIEQSLKKEGFTDVKIVAESFVVQGKSPDGNPVVMTIGPQGMSVFEAMNANGSSSGTVGSNSGTTGSNEGTTGSSNTSSPSMNSKSSTQQK